MHNSKRKNRVLGPYIEIKESDLKLEINLEDIVKRKLENVQSVCPLCGYDKNKKIISKTYFKIFNRIEVPKFVFVNFELLMKMNMNYIIQKKILLDRCY